MEKYPATIMVRVSAEVKGTIANMATEEERTVANMARVLIHEAIRKREEERKRKKVSK